MPSYEGELISRQELALAAGGVQVDSQQLLCFYTLHFLLLSVYRRSVEYSVCGQLR